jgi:hypothetical protein
MAYSIRNARAIVAVLFLSVILVLALYQSRCTPAVVSDAVVDLPVLEVRRMGEDASLYHLRLAPPGADEIWIRWYGQGTPPGVGSMVSVRVTVLEGGEREYFLLQRRQSLGI